MTLVLTNVYLFDEEKSLLSMTHLVTGFVGAFETEEMAMKVYREKLKESGVSEEDCDDHIDKFGLIRHTEILLDDNLKYCGDDFDKAMCLFQITMKDFEMNKVYRYGE